MGHTSRRHTLVGVRADTNLSAKKREEQ